VVLVRSRRGIEDKLSGVGGDSGNDKHEGTYHDLLLDETCASSTCVSDSLHDHLSSVTWTLCEDIED
jgi:hypothetical protein